MTNIQKFGILFAAVIAVLFAEYQFYFKGIFNELNKLKSEYHFVETEIKANIPENIRGTDTESARIAISKELAEMSQKIPGEDELPQVIQGFIKDSSKNAIIDYKELYPSTLVEEDDYKKLTISAKFSSDFSNFVNYLENLELMPLIIRVDDLSFDEDPKLHLINAKIGISTFFGKAGIRTAAIKEEISESKEAVKKEPKKKSRRIAKKRFIPPLYYRGFFKGTITKAFINDELLSVGEKIDGFLINEIAENYIIVSKGEKSYTLKIGR